jgi:hypothetical protein
MEGIKPKGQVKELEPHTMEGDWIFCSIRKTSGGLGLYLTTPGKGLLSICKALGLILHCESLKKKKKKNSGDVYDSGLSGWTT